MAGTSIPVAFFASFAALAEGRPRAGVETNQHQEARPFGVDGFRRALATTKRTQSVRSMCGWATASWSAPVTTDGLRGSDYKRARVTERTEADGSAMEGRPAAFAAGVGQNAQNTQA